MSHVSKIELIIKDLAALKNACKSLGFEFHQGQRTYRWYGRYVGDAPLPEGMKVADLGKCEHAISVPHADYQIGVIKSEEGFQLFADLWGPGGLEQRVGKNCGLLKQEYTVQRVRNEAKRRCMRIAQQKDRTGTIRLTLTS